MHLHIQQQYPPGKFTHDLDLPRLLKDKETDRPDHIVRAAGTDIVEVVQMQSLAGVSDLERYAL